MAPENEAGNGEIARKMINFRCFTSPIRFPPKFEGEEIELSLGLSLNGRFGVDPKMLARSSSAAAAADFGVNRRALKAEEDLPMRTCSLPAETEELRMESKRKRDDKQRNLRPVKRSTLGGEDGVFNPQNVPHAPHAPPSQGWVSSPGSGSSCVSDLDSKPIQGANKCTEAASPSSTDTENKSPAVIAGATITEKPGEFSGIIIKNQSETSSVLERMPCVSTRGDGPNGRRIQGFLYRYRKGEEPSIVCVCHGSFLSPAEFIRHAGGGDVEHPLKHIVVSSSPSL